MIVGRSLSRKRKRRLPRQRHGPSEDGVNTTTNVLTANTSFAQPLGTAGQRIIQLAMRFTF